MDNNIENKQLGIEENNVPNGTMPMESNFGMPDAIGQGEEVVEESVSNNPMPMREDFGMSNAIGQREEVVEESVPNSPMPMREDFGMSNAIGQREEVEEESVPNSPMPMREDFGMQNAVEQREEVEEESVPNSPMPMREDFGMQNAVEQKEEVEEEDIRNKTMNDDTSMPNFNNANQKNVFEVNIDELESSTNLLQTQINKIQNEENIYECGRVIKVTNFIVEVSGLDNLSFFEKVKIGDSAIGYVNGILENSVTVALLSNTKTIKIDDKVYSTGETLNTFFSNQFVGRIIDMFGNDLYAENKFEKMIKINIENNPVPLMDRGTVNRPLQTGISGLDLIYPIGKGQRQLIVGDKKTGKTQLCLDVIANQQGKNVLCIYVAIGKTKKEVKSIYTELQAKGALSYTMIISAFNDDKPPIIYLTPYAALSIAEVFMKSKYDVLVVIDDLKRHADAYREISLVSGKTPGRDAYPADIFYTHSRLLEKGCQLESGGSITILPIVETKAEDITDYITTNIISITDGQIYLSSKLFNKGQKPAIDYGLSVSRLGGNVQENDIKKLGSAVRLKLLNYLETQDVYQFANLDEMGGNLKSKIIEGKKIMDLLNQNKFTPKTKEEIINDFNFVLGETNEG